MPKRKSVRTPTTVALKSPRVMALLNASTTVRKRGAWMVRAVNAGGALDATVAMVAVGIATVIVPAALLLGDIGGITGGVTVMPLKGTTRLIEFPAATAKSWPTWLPMLAATEVT